MMEPRAYLDSFQRVTASNSQSNTHCLDAATLTYIHTYCTTRLPHIARVKRLSLFTHFLTDVKL